jgi:hypothetical protein
MLANDSLSYNKIDLTVYIEAPAPRYLGSEDSSKDWTYGASKSPHHANHTIVGTSVPHAKEITDAYVD